MLKANRFRAEGKNIPGNLPHLVDVVLRERRNLRRSLRVGWNEASCCHPLHPLQRLEIGGHIVDKADLIFIKRLPARQAVRQKNHVIRRPKARHIEEMAGKRDQFKPLRQNLLGQGLCIALLRHQKLVAQLTAGTAAVQKGRFQYGMSGKITFDARSIDAAPGLRLQVPVATDMVGVGVGVIDGGQLPPLDADHLIELVNAIENELAIKVEDEKFLQDKGLIKIIGPEVDDAYNEKVLTISEQPNLSKEVDVHVVFTPLHGTANLSVRRALADLGYENVAVVKEQELPDPEFSTVSSPNPEEHAAFKLAIQKGKETNADILVGTDPDADRVGVAVKDESGEYTVLTGNQTGALFLDYILSQKKEKGELPSNGIVFKTIVTSEFGRKIASSYGMKTEDVLTGFKFIGEKIKQYEESGEYAFLFGYEESYGSLIKDFARDKDAVQASVMAVEICAHYKRQGKTVYEALQDLYEKHGYYLEGMRSLTLKGKEGAEKIQHILSQFRSTPLASLSGVKVTAVEDYKESVRTEIATGNTSEIHLPKSNVIKYFFEDESWVCLRPSGTEPKIKFYFAVKDDSKQASEQKLQQFMNEMMEKVEQI